jgi:hypothetical protein
VYLRRTLLFPLDDLLALTCEFLNEGVSRSGLSRCLRRHCVGDLAEFKPKVPALVHESFQGDVPGFLPMNIKYLPQMADQTSHNYLFMAIDRATRWVFVQIKTDR